MHQPNAVRRPRGARSFSGSLFISSTFCGAISHDPISTLTSAGLLDGTFNPAKCGQVFTSFLYIMLSNSGKFGKNW
jgi:hypothetical protein